MAPNPDEMIHSSGSMDLDMPRSSQIDKTSWREKFRESKGMLLVLTSESFGAAMAATTRLLETGDDGGMSVLQIIFVRFGITYLLSTLYMWYVQTPDFPFGKQEVRRLLVLRGTAGLVAVYGFYYSLKYLPVAEVLLLSFTTPLLTSYACSLFLHEPFIKKQLFAGLISLFGILLIAHPAAFFGSPSSPSPSRPTRGLVPDPQDVTPMQRLSAIAMAIISVLGATTAYTSIRAMGNRVHPLISVNYYSFISTLLSSFALLLPVYPESFRLPHGSYEWVLLIGLGVFGFGLQSLMTAGLAKDKGGRAINMMYSSVVFGLLIDWLIWGIVPGIWSAVGGSVVVAATVWGAMLVPEKRKMDEEFGMVTDEEGVFLVEDEESSEDDGAGDDIEWENDSAKGA